MKKTLLLFIMTLVMSLNVVANDIKTLNTPKSEMFTSIKVNMPCVIKMVESDSCAYNVATDKDTYKMIDCKIIDGVLIINKKPSWEFDQIDSNNIRIYIEAPADVKIDYARGLEVIDRKKRG